MRAARQGARDAARGDWVPAVAAGGGRDRRRARRRGDQRCAARAVLKTCAVLKTRNGWEEDMAKILEGKIALVTVAPAASAVRWSGGSRARAPRSRSCTARPKPRRARRRRSGGARRPRQGLSRQSGKSRDAARCGEGGAHRFRPDRHPGQLRRHLHRRHDRRHRVSDYERAMNVNLDSVYYLTSEVSKTMQPGSRIINISSTLAERAGGAAIAVYNATKAGVSSLARSWAHDLGSRGILVNAIQPGHINTDMNRTRPTIITRWSSASARPLCRARGNRRRGRLPRRTGRRLHHRRDHQRRRRPERLRPEYPE